MQEWKQSRVSGGMGMAAAIIVPGVNGADFARVVSARVPSGRSVSIGEIVLEVENHKVVQEIEAPSGGVLIHDLHPGDVVRLDVPVAYVAAPGEDISHLAADAQDAKVQAGSDCAHGLGGSSVPAGVIQPLSVAKATEIAVLGGGAGNSLLATLGIEIGTVRRSERTASFFRDKILDLVVYESSRLLMGDKYRSLNSMYSAGHIIQYERVAAGISFDDGRRLTIYGLPDSATLSLADTQDHIIAGLMRYVGRKLTLKDVTSATFTVTDTSSTELSLSVPLLPRNQCIIISITRDRGDSFQASISYDHRITEGLTVAGFAGELAQRIRSYSAPAPEPMEPACAFCERTVSMEKSNFGRRGLLRMVDASGQELWCCASCWDNW